MNFLKATILISVSLLSTAYAQKIKVKYYPEEKLTEKAPGMFNIDKEYKYTEDEEFEYKRKIVNNSDKTFFVEKVQKRNGQVIWRKEILLTEEDKKDKADILRLETVKSGFALFLRKKDSKSKSIVITARKLDENFKSIQNEQIVYTQKNKDEAFTIITKSRNHFIICCYISQWSYKNVPFNYMVIDEDFNMVWEKSIVPSATLFHRLDKVTLDKGLNFFAIYKYASNGKELGYRDAQDIMLVSYNYKNDDLKTKPLNLGSKMKVAYGLTSEFDTLNNFIGFYGGYNKTKAGIGAEGIFNFEYDMNTLEPAHENLTPYSNEILERFKGLKKGEFPRFLSIRNRMKDKSGAITFVLEESVEMVTEQPAGSVSTSKFDYGNIFIINTLPTGVIKWTQVILRDNNTTLGSYLDYYTVFSFNYNKITYVAFNTAEAIAINPEKYEGYAQGYDDDKVLILFGFDEAGQQVLRESITPKVNKKLWCNITRIKLSDENQLGLTFEMPDGISGKVSSKLNATVEIE